VSLVLNLQDEVWKQVGNGIYEVSNLSRVRRAQAGPGTRKNHVLKQSIASMGYPVVTFCVNGKRKIVYVHSLVAEAFIGERPEGYMVNHKDGIKTNNLPENLEYVTRQENMEHASRMGLLQSGENHWHSRRRRENEKRS
jgi:hypothetical protein